MARKPTKNPRLVERDYDIFEHIMRYRLTTREILHKLLFSDCEINAVTKVLSRLTQHRFLNSYELIAPRMYWVLGPEATKLLGKSPKVTKELGPLALTREFGALAYCCLTEHVRERLTVSEIHHHYPDLLHGQLDSSHYYLDNDGSATRLAYIRVDHGGPPEHVVRKCRQDLTARLRHEAFRNVVSKDQFMIAVVTGREEKADAIRQVLGRHQWTIRFRVEVVPDLAQLLIKVR